MNLLVIDRSVSPGYQHTRVYQVMNRLDHLAKTVSCQPYTGREPALPMPYNAVKTTIRQWAYVQANNCWQNIKTCRQAN